VLAFIIPVALLAGGFAAGGLMISALGGAPMLLSLSVENYLSVHKGFIGRFDPFMPICICTALVADAVLAFLVPIASAHACPARALTTWSIKSRPAVTPALV